MANVTVTKGKSVVTNGVVPALFQFGLYKPSQGRIARQVTGWVLFAVVLLFAWRLRVGDTAMGWGLAALVSLMGGWLSYRVVNIPRFADFLIAVEAEMHKVTWPTWPQLVRASTVVMVSMAVLAIVLFLFDVLWRFVFTTIGILKS